MPATLCLLPTNPQTTEVQERNPVTGTELKCHVNYSLLPDNYNPNFPHPCQSKYIWGHTSDNDLSFTVSGLLSLTYQRLTMMWMTPLPSRKLLFQLKPPWGGSHVFHHTAWSFIATSSWKAPLSLWRMLFSGTLSDAHWMVLSLHLLSDTPSHAFYKWPTTCVLFKYLI